VNRQFQLPGRLIQVDAAARHVRPLPSHLR
jgi:hypothetical protein